MGRELKGLEGDPEAIKHLESLSATRKKYKTGKRQTITTYKDSGLKIYFYPR